MGSVTGIDSKKKTGKYKRGKSNFLMKGVRAKLTSTWEGGGIRGKKHTNKLYLDKGAHSYHYPNGKGVNFASTPVRNRANTLNHQIFVNLGCMSNFSLLGHVEVEFLYFPGRWLRSLCVTGCAA